MLVLPDTLQIPELSQGKAGQFSRHTERKGCFEDKVYTEALLAYFDFLCGLTHPYSYMPTHSHPTHMQITREKGE